MSFNDFSPLVCPCKELSRGRGYPKCSNGFRTALTICRKSFKRSAPPSSTCTAHRQERLGPVHAGVGGHRKWINGFLHALTIFSKSFKRSAPPSSTCTAHRQERLGSVNVWMRRSPSSLVRTGGPQPSLSVPCGWVLW